MCRLCQTLLQKDLGSLTSLAHPGKPEARPARRSDPRRAACTYSGLQDKPASFHLGKEQARPSMAGHASSGCQDQPNQ